MAKPQPAPPITHLRDLTPDPRNARRHTPRNTGVIEQALRDVGAARSIVIDEDGTVLAGNATIEAAAAAGIERVQVVDADGETIIAVRRSGLTPAQKTRLALADNRAAELAEWDAGVLAAIAADDAGALDGLWYADELPIMPVELSEPGAGGDDFDAAPVTGPTRCQLGDLWQLGPHRLIVGDCTDPLVLDRLMGGDRAVMVFTDPPYKGDLGEGGFKTDPDLRARSTKRKTDIVRLYDFNPNDVLPLLTGVTCSPASYFFFCNKIQVPIYLNRALATDRLFDILAWHKPNFIPSNNHSYFPDTEYLIKLKDHSAPFNTGIPKEEVNYGRYWIIEQAEKIDHPTVKPIKVILDCIRICSKAGDIVADPFLGSGTTLIAAQRTGRICYGCEIEPHYADVILRRWEAETGIAPILTTEGVSTDGP